MKRVVVACFGDAQSTAVIKALTRDAEVIAVAMDFGGLVSLAEMRDVALAAGALRCHALDVREDFARDSLLPALRAGAYVEPTAAFTALAPAFATGKLEEIARIEGASVIAPRAVVVVARPLTKSAPPPVHLEVRFENGVPVAVNGVEMTLTELMESLETITGEPALHVLSRQLSESREHQFA